MPNLFALPTIRLVQRLSMLLTVFSCIYVVFFLCFRPKDNALKVATAPGSDAPLLAPAPVFDLKPYDIGAQARDIFSMNTPTDGTSSSTLENTPKGQLPDHLKIVGIVIGHPSQIVIEDSSVNKTYFIEEGNPQAGIKIMQVRPDQMIINYQGQNISVPVSKD